MLEKSLNSYQLGKLIGQGGMGSVYEALDTRTGTSVAIKILDAAEMNKNSGCISRFRREVEVAGSIETPHIAALLDAGADPETGAPFMVMERLQGEDLNQLLRRVGSLVPEVALRIVAQVCEGLMRAHKKGVIHRDIKPANLFLARQPDGRVVVKILDFGIAKITLENWQHLTAAGLTRTGSLLGSPQYMSPEQVRMARDVDARADLWSLGVVLYHALSGRVPYEELDTFGDLIIAICTEQPRPIREVAPWVPAEVAAIVERSLRLEPADRFKDAAEMLAAIAALLPGGTELELSMLAPRGEAERAMVEREMADTLDVGAVIPADREPGEAKLRWLPWPVRRAV